MLQYTDHRQAEYELVIPFFDAMYLLNVLREIERQNLAVADLKTHPLATRLGRPVPCLVSWCVLSARRLLGHVEALQILAAFPPEWTSALRGLLTILWPFRMATRVHSMY